MAAAAAETQLREVTRACNKRKFERGKGGEPKKDRRGRIAGKDVRSDKKMRKQQHAPGERMRRSKRAAKEEHGSDEEEEEEGIEQGRSSEEEEGGDDSEGQEDGGGSEDGGDATEQEGATKFTNGCRAFRMAFTKIMSKNIAADSLLGPILSAHKKLVAEKLADEEDEEKSKGEVKKEKHLAGEKGHVKPASFLDSKEKFLISVATKGVVKLFNAVNKAQNPQKGLNPSRSKDAKVLAKRRKEAFFSELKKSTTPNDNHSKFNHTKIKSADEENSDEPGWAPLRDSYMLTSSKLKDWDKMADLSTSVEPDPMPSESSDEE